MSRISLATRVQRGEYDPGVAKGNRLPSIEELNTVFRFDPATGQLYWRRLPSRSRKTLATQPVGNDNSHGYLRVKYDGRAYLVHRIIFKLIYGYEPPQVDHRDGNRVNNRANNLRPATRELNSRNKGVGRPGKTLPCGINKERGRFRVRIMLDGQRRHIGSFVDLKSATAARHQAEAKFFGEFARSANGGTECEA